VRTNSDLCHLYHKLIGFYNHDEKCLQRGTDWAFKQSGLPFVFKGLNRIIPVFITMGIVKEISGYFTSFVFDF